MRNYKAEYQRRIERGLARGLTRSQARGHAKPRPPLPKRKPTLDPIEAERFQFAIKALRKRGSQKAAAQEAGISAKRFRRFLREHQIAERQGRTWIIRDDLEREMVLYTRRGRLKLKLNDYASARLAGEHLAAVKRLVETQDSRPLERFKGATITDASGKTHVFETNPNTLYRLTSSGHEGFEQVYRFIL